MLNTRFFGSFEDVCGHRWGVRILQEGFSGEVGELTFPDDEPLLIEWEAKSKDEVIQGSSATLTIVSPGDRTYIDMYTVKAAEIVLCVTRDNKLWWSGSLDPEFYEEPYQDKSGYEVQLTFTDFGILDRLKWDDLSFVTLNYVIETAILRASIFTDDRAGAYVLTEAGARLITEAGSPVVTEYPTMSVGTYDTLISSKMDDSDTAGLDTKDFDLSAIMVTGANFFDEDSEANSLKEVLEAVLQPLGLRIIQRAGKVLIYDLHAVSELPANGFIEWSGNSQTLSADSVLNNVKITFSPYEHTGLIDTGFDANDLESDRFKNYNYAQSEPEAIPFGPEYLEWPTDYSGDWVPGFRLHAKANDPDKTGFETWHTPVAVRALFSGADESAVLIGAALPDSRTKPYQTIGSRLGTLVRAPKDKAGVAVVPPGITITPLYPKHVQMLPGIMPAMKTKPVYIGKENGQYRLRVSLQTLIDVRYNPFEQAGKYNEKGNYDEMQQVVNLAYIPGSITLRDGNGNILYYYTNASAISSFSAPNPIEIAADNGQWIKTVNGVPRPDTYFFSFYKVDNRKTDTGLGGWQNNRQTIGLKFDGLPTIFDKLPTGDLIPPPPVSGYIVVEVHAGFYQIADSCIERMYIYDWVRWFMVKDLKVDIVGMYGQELESHDMEYTGWLEPDAYENLEIDTLCGMGDDTLHGARGLYLRTSNQTPISKITRAGVKDCCEKLLIGTMYSHYATRHTVLQGECYVPDGVLPVMIERNQGDRKFMPAGETMDCGNGVTEIKWVEVLPDDYKSVNWDN